MNKCVDATLGHCVCKIYRGRNSPECELLYRVCCKCGYELDEDLRGVAEGEEIKSSWGDTTQQEYIKDIEVEGWDG